MKLTCNCISSKFLGQQNGESDTASKDLQVKLLHFVNSHKEIQYLVFTEIALNNALILIWTKEN